MEPTEDIPDGFRTLGSGASWFEWIVKVHQLFTQTFRSLIPSKRHSKFQFWRYRTTCPCLTRATCRAAESRHSPGGWLAPLALANSGCLPGSWLAPLAPRLIWAAVSPAADLHYLPRDWQAPFALQWALATGGSQRARRQHTAQISAQLVD